MTGLGQDLRFGFRALARKPVVTTAAVASLALGIAGNSLLFSVVNSVLLQPLPYREPDRLAQVFITSDGAGAFPLDAEHFKAWRDQNHTLEGLSAIDYGDSYNYVRREGTERLLGVRASANFFDLLGVRAQIGRTFERTEEVPGNDRVLVLSHELWQTVFGGDPSIVGHGFPLNGEVYTVIGVLPASFRFAMRANARLWSPLAIDADRTGGRHLDAIARLKPRMSLQAADSDLDAIADRLANQRPAHARVSRQGARLRELKEQTVGRVRPVVVSLFCAMAFLLLITCANLSNLFLARAIERRNEITIRAALGASRFRLARQLLVESLLLSAFAGAMAVLLTTWGLDALQALSPAGLPRLDELRLDYRVLTFTAAISVAVGVVFGFAPLIRFSGALMLRNTTKTSLQTRAAKRTRSSLVAAQVALTTVLLAGAGLMARSLAGMLAVDPGFNPNRVLTFAVSLPTGGYPNPAAIEAYYRELRRRLTAIPDVDAVGATNFNASLDVGTGSLNITPEAPTTGARELELADFRLMTPGYFSALRIPLLSGRDFDEADIDGDRPIAIVNHTLAQRYWRGETAVGKAFRAGGNERITIVGVVGDVREEGLHQEIRSAVYFPASGFPDRTVLVRMAADHPSSTATIRDVVRSVDGTVPMYEVKTMNQVLDRWAAPRRFPVIVLLSFAGVALALAAIGLFGVITHMTSSRTAEIGLRMALGASQRDVFKMVWRDGMGMVAGGLVIGFITTTLAMRTLQSYLFKIRPTDPVTMLAVAVIFLSVGMAAIYAPARRATRIEPAAALRDE